MAAGVLNAAAEVICPTAPPSCSEGDRDGDGDNTATLGATLPLAKLDSDAEFVEDADALCCGAALCTLPPDTLADAEDTADAVDDELARGDADALGEPDSDDSSESVPVLVALAAPDALGDRVSRLDADGLRERRGDADDVPVADADFVARDDNDAAPDAEAVVVRDKEADAVVVTVRLGEPVALGDLLVNDD